MQNGSERFTGERYIPGIADDKLKIEHYQRYLTIRKLLSGKTVLDAACGEGYGSSILASVADKVMGIDIDEETVQRARIKYGEISNLTYFQGSVENLPFEDNSVDVIVSFETIEHVPEEVQTKFLDEIKRVLKEDGMLIMSTPNKRIYSDLHNYKNEYHIREFYHDEFVTFLEEKFRYVQMYNQAFQVTSMITACAEEGGQIDFYNKDTAYNQEGKYYIAIASNVKIENVNISSAYMNLSGEYEAMVQRIIELQSAENVRNEHIQNLDTELNSSRKRIFELQEEVERRNQHIQNLDKEIDIARRIIADLQAEVEEKNQHIKNLDLQIEEQKK